jgi:hypothetical protein
VEFLINDIGHLLIQGPQRNIHRACLIAKAAVNTPAGHVYGPGQVKCGDLRGDFTGANQFIVFQAAFPAKAHGADIPAPVTLDAFGKFLHPAFKTAFKIKPVNVLYRQVGTPFDLFPGQKFIRVWLDTLTHLCQFPGAGNPHRNDLPGVQLVPDKQGFEAAFITAAHQNTKSIFRIGTGKMDELLVERIPAVSRSLPVTHHHVVQIIFITKKVRAHLTVPFAKSQKALDLF